MPSALPITACRVGAKSTSSLGLSPDKAIYILHILNWADYPTRTLDTQASAFYVLKSEFRSSVINISLQIIFPEHGVKLLKYGVQARVLIYGLSIWNNV
jgi:hypothetical protein